MEVTLEAETPKWSLGKTSCFNPYSNGSYSGSFFSWLQARFFRRVSILILMEVTLEAIEVYSDECFYFLFQSLF